MDVMLQRISQEDSIDVFGFVRQMRFQRNFMVQTEVSVIQLKTFFLFFLFESPVELENEVILDFTY